MTFDACPSCGAPVTVTWAASCPECGHGFGRFVGEGRITPEAVAFEIRQYVWTCGVAQRREFRWPDMVEAMNAFLSSPRFGPVGCTLKVEANRAEGLVLDRDETPVVRVGLASPGVLRAEPIDERSRIARSAGAVKGLMPWRRRR